MLVHDRNHDRVDKILSERALILLRKRENLRNDVVKEAMKLYSGKKKDAHFDDLRSSDYLRWLHYCVTAESAPMRSSITMWTSPHSERQFSSFRRVINPPSQVENRVI